MHILAGIHNPPPLTPSNDLQVYSGQGDHKKAVQYFKMAAAEEPNEKVNMAAQLSPCREGQFHCCVVLLCMCVWLGPHAVHSEDASACTAASCRGEPPGKGHVQKNDPGAGPGRGGGGGGRGRAGNQQHQCQTGESTALGHAEQQKLTCPLLLPSGSMAVPRDSFHRGSTSCGRGLLHCHTALTEH